MSHTPASIAPPIIAPTAAPFAAPRGPAIKKPIPAPINADEKSISIPFNTFNSVVMASYRPVAKPATPPTIIATIPSLDEKPAKAVVKVLLVNVFPIQFAINRPNTAILAELSNIPPTVSAKLKPSRPFLIESSIPLIAKVIPTMLTVAANVIL